MVVAGLVIETVPRSAESVARRLGRQPGLEIKGVDGDCRIAAVWTGESGEDLEQASERIVAEDEEVLGIFPTFVGQDEE